MVSAPGADQGQDQGNDIPFLEAFRFLLDLQQGAEEVVLFRLLAALGDDFQDDVDGLVAVLPRGLATLIGDGRVPGLGEGQDDLS